MIYKELVDNFIKPNIPVYGLLGTNMIENPKREYFTEREETPIMPPSGGNNLTVREYPVLSKNNHMVFGYDGEVFNSRESSSSMFWTDYGNTTDNNSNIHKVILNSVFEILSDLGPCVFITDDSISWNYYNWFTGVLKSFNLPMIDVKDLLGHYLVGEERDLVRTNSRTSCVKISLANSLKIPVIDTTIIPRVVDQNFGVGETYYCLVDQEEDYGFARWLVLNFRRGVPFFWKWSPELLWLTFDVIQRDISGGTYMHRDPHVWLDMKHDKADETWITPVGDSGEQFYGRVFRDN